MKKITSELSNFAPVERYIRRGEDVKRKKNYEREATAGLIARCR